MASVTTTTKGGRTGTGALALSLPSASSSYLAAIFHQGNLTLASGWTQVQDIVLTGTIAVTFYRATPGTSPATNWAFTQSFNNAVAAGVIVGYDDVPTNITVVSTTPGAESKISPDATMGSNEGLAARFLTDAGTGPTATYPTGHSLGQDQFRQVSSGATALVAVAHKTATAGSVGTATWTLGGVTDGAMAYTVVLEFPTGATPTMPAITTSTLDSIQIGTAFSQTLAATGGIPITWSIQAGSLPPGLSLNTTTGEITGTPTGFSAGTWAYDVTIRATNSEGYDDQSYAGSILFPSETSRGTLEQTAGGTPYQSIRLTISGDNALMYAPYGKALGTSSVAMMVAHGAEDDENFIDNNPWATVEHCLDNGWVLICPNAGGNQFANSIAENAYANAVDYVNALWPVSDFIWYGFSMGANAGVVLFTRYSGVFHGYPIKGLVFIDLPWDMLWHWNNGSGWEHSLILDAYGGYDASYDAATYPQSIYSGMKAFVSWSPDDTVAIATHDALAMQSYTSGYASLTMYQSYGEHENPPHFAPTEVNAWLDGLIGGTPNTFDRLYVGSVLADRAYVGDTLVWE